MTDVYIAPKHKGGKTAAGNAMHPMNILASFSRKPDGVYFQTQKPKEAIVLFLRAHFATNLPWISMTFLLTIMPLILIDMLSRLNPDFFSPIISRSSLIVVPFYYLMVFTYTFIKLLKWFYNVFIVTTERVVDIDYSDIVISNMAVTHLSHVQDVSYTQSGFIPTYLNYGNLFVQTAGTEENFEAYSIPNPREATDIIEELTESK
jgi:hypothetical protein